MVVDEKIAFVKSLNWATKNLTESRDYAISTTHPHGVREIIECFDADWNRQTFKPGLSAHMIWCPVNGATVSPGLLMRRSTRSSSRTSVIRIQSSSSASSAPRCAG